MSRIKNISISAYPNERYFEFNSDFRNLVSLVKEPLKKGNTVSNVSFADVFANLHINFLSKI